MNISSSGIDFIKDREGLSLQAYKPVKSEKYWTIGYGSSGPDVYQGQTITQYEANQMLRDDLFRVATCIQKSVSVPLQQCEIDALASLIFNIGTGAWRQSHARELLNQNDYDGFDAQAFGKYGWIHDATGVVNEGLQKRRQLEHNLFFENDYAGA